MERLFFNNTINNDKCRHSTINECEKERCWYANNLAYRCLQALHDKEKHANCKGEYLLGYSSGKKDRSKGAAIYTECNCLCHEGKYYSPIQGKWV